MILFHGTNMDFEKTSLEFAKERRDFGRGFYTTTIKEQAESWAEAMCERRITAKAFLYEFEFTKENLNCKLFDGISEEWLRFIVKNRIQGGIQHDFDVVQGPVADDRIFPTITLFFNGRYDVEYTLKRLRFFQPNDQLSIHSEKALRNLSLMEKRSWQP
jgi:hypothetical protein